MPTLLCSPWMSPAMGSNQTRECSPHVPEVTVWPNICRTCLAYYTCAYQIHIQQQGNRRQYGKILELHFKDQDAIPRTPRVTLATTVTSPAPAPICKKQNNYPSFLFHPSLQFKLGEFFVVVSLSQNTSSSQYTMSSSAQPYGNASKNKIKGTL